MVRTYFLALLFAFGSSRAFEAPPRLVVLDLELTGDLGDPELAAEHQARIQKESAFLRDELAATGRYRVIDAQTVDPLVSRFKNQYRYLHDCNGCDLQIAQQLDADQVLLPWVYRVSALILTLTYEIHDTRTGKIVSRKSYDFRGDNDAAWTHAIRFMVRHLGDAAVARQPSQSVPAERLSGEHPAEVAPVATRALSHANLLVFGHPSSR